MYKQFHKAVRQACEDNGWDVWSTYNDKRSTCVRRLSYSRNGWELPEEMKDNILVAVRELVKVFNINGAVYWHKAKHPYGLYDKLCVDIHSEDVE